MQKISRQEAKKRGMKRYFTGETCKNGHNTERMTSTRKCIGCRQMWGRDFWRKRKSDKPLYWAIKNAKSRALKKGLEFSLPDDFAVPTRCPCCGKTLCLDNSKIRDDSPSLDRLDNAIGYTVENVNIICARCNSIKNSGTSKEHRQIADWMDSFSNLGR